MQSMILNSTTRLCASNILCLLLVCTISGCSIYPTTQVAGRVKERIVELTPRLQGFVVDVAAKSRGEVELSGTVSSELDHQKVLDAARSVEGVESIVDNLKVVSAKGRAGTSRFESEIITTLDQELVGSQYTLSVADRGAEVVVGGEVDSQLTKSRVLEIARSIVGNKGSVTDSIVLTPAPSDTWIKNKVASELLTRFPQWKERVAVVDVQKGVVKLSGSLDDHWDIDSVLAAVVMVPGVRDLRSEITIHGAPYSSGGLKTATGHQPQ